MVLGFVAAFIGVVEASGKDHADLYDIDRRHQEFSDAYEEWVKNGGEAIKVHVEGHKSIYSPDLVRRVREYFHRHEVGERFRVLERSLGF